MTLTVTYGTASLINSGAASGTVVGPSCAAGDMLIAAICYGGGSPPLGASGITGGSGGTWTQVTGEPVGGVNTTGHAGQTLATKTAAAGDSAATFTVNFSQSNRKAILWVIVASDTNGTPAIGASSATYSSTAGTALTSPAITIAAGSRVLALFTDTGGSSGSYTPGTWTGTATGLTGTERDDQTNTASSQSAAELQDGGGAATGAGTVTAKATSTASVEWTAGIAEIVPAAAAAPALPPELVMAPMTGA